MAGRSGAVRRRDGGGLPAGAAGGAWPGGGAWLLHQDGVTGPIIGPRTLEQLDSAQRALEIHLDADVLARLDEIFPGYKTAPEHYAW